MEPPPQPSPGPVGCSDAAYRRYLATCEYLNIDPADQLSFPDDATCESARQAECNLLTVEDQLSSLKSIMVSGSRYALEKHNPGFTDDLQCMLESGQMDASMQSLILRNMGVASKLLGPEVSFIMGIFVLWSNRQALNAGSADDRADRELESSIMDSK